MSWNQPGGRQQPPDLDDIFRKIVATINRLFGDRGGVSNGRQRRGGGFSSLNIGFFVVIALVIWGLSGIYIISEGSRGVVLRFGEFQDATMPGPHWHIPYPIETVEKIDVDRIRSAQNKSHMLTKDENIVEVEIATQYRVKNAPNYLFNVRLPDTAETSISQSEGTLFQVMESALRARCFCRRDQGTRRRDSFYQRGGSLR